MKSSILGIFSQSCPGLLRPPRHFESGDGPGYEAGLEYRYKKQKTTEQIELKYRLKYRVFMIMARSLF